MEAAPLTLAHAHVRNAVLETKRSNPVAASEEHDLAAAEFATAAQGTADSEALRILNLLEQQHRKLGNILKSQHEKPKARVETAADAANAQPKSEAVSKRTSTPPQASLEGQATAPDTLHSPPRLNRPPRATARDLSSSIASNLASARGIPRDRLRKPTPANPTVSAQHAGGNFARDQASPYAKTPNERQENNRRPSWTPPTAVAEEKDVIQSDRPSADAPFQQFYSTFESLISRISAPLAFAGLPLTSNLATTQSGAPSSVTKSKRPRTPPAAAAAPLEYSHLISQAAMNALRDGPAHHNPAESFYVVPTTGGTISYAEVMSRAEREQSARHHRTLSGIRETTNDDFVDANSTILDVIRPSSRKGNEARIIEEQSIQIDALKKHIDSLTKRLQVFELTSQTSTAALAQSIRSLPQSPGATPDNSRGKSTTQSRRIAELEALLEKNSAELRKRKEESAELKTVLKRYREKWEKLKEGARARRVPDGAGGVATSAVPSAAAAVTERQQDDDEPE